MMQRVVLFLFVLIGHEAFAQHDEASREFFDGLTDCAASFGGWKCLVLDLSSEVVEDEDSTKVYVYSWNFGDGTRVHGEKVEHCYEQFGSYQVTMDLLDNETNTVIRSELSSTLNLYPEIYPAITVNTENLPPTYMEFRNSVNDDSFDPDQVFWRIDEAYYEGPSIMHAFPAAGVYQVQMAVVKDMGFLGTATACATKEITVKESDLWTSQLTGFIREAHRNQNAGPFSTTEVTCLLQSASGDPSAFVVIPLSSLMNRFSVKTDEEYKITLFSGNLFTETKRFDSHGLSGNDLYHALRDTVKTFIRQPVMALPAITLDEGGAHTLSDHPVLRKIAAILQDNSHFKIMIGAYLFTGSRIPKGIHASVERAKLVKEALVGMGVTPDRLAIASPEHHSALMNTCSAEPDCEWEDPALDGRIEFTIIGIDL